MSRRERRRDQKSSICWKCRRTNRFLCKWFDPDHQEIPKSAEHVTKEDYAYDDGKRKVVVIIKCPDFEPEEMENTTNGKKD